MALDITANILASYAMLTCMSIAIWLTAFLHCIGLFSKKFSYSYMYIGTAK